MSVILKDSIPPSRDVSKLGSHAAMVYSILWSSALMDSKYDKRFYLDWKDRLDTGGTTTWTVKGLADNCGSDHRTITKALDKLLDAGFIQAINYVNAGYGRLKTIWRVTHPDQLDAVRYAIDVIGSPAKTWHKRLNPKGYKGEIYDTTEKAPIDYELQAIPYPT